MQRYSAFQYDKTVHVRKKHYENVEELRLNAQFSPPLN